MRVIATLLFLAGIAGAQTVNLRDSGEGIYFCGASNTTPIVMQTCLANDIQTGDHITIWNVPFNSTGTCGDPTLTPVNVLYGEFIATRVDATHFSIADVSSNPIPARGTWCDGAKTSNGGPQFGGKTTPYTLSTSPMRAWFDGDSGPWTRSLSLGTNNGLTSLVVASNVATVVTSFTGYVTTGDKIAIWNSGNSTLDRGPGGTGTQHNGYTVTVDSPTQFHFTTSGVPDGTYSNALNTCGPSGTADCMRVSAIAITGNVFWDALIVATTTGGNAFLDAQPRIDGGTSDFYPQSGGGSVWAVEAGLAVSIHFLVDQTNTTAIQWLKDTTNHIEHYLSANWVLDENYNEGGYSNWTDTISWQFEGLAAMWPIVKPYLSSTEKQRFIDKMMNDLSDPQGCVRATVINKVGATISYNGAGTITGTGTLWLTDPDPNLRLNVGDALFKPDFYNGDTRNYYVTAVNSDTSITILASPPDATTWSGSTFQFVHKWTDGTAGTPRSCGALWLKKHWLGAVSHEILYPASGGNYAKWFSSTIRPNQPTNGGNNQYTWSAGSMAFTATVADDDAVMVNGVHRTTLHFEEFQNLWFDWYLPYSQAYTTGFQHAGAYYSFGRTLKDGSEAAFHLKTAVPTFPVDTTGTWVTRAALLKIFGILPDNFSGYLWPARWGSEDPDNRVKSDSCEYTIEWAQRLAPTSLESGYFLKWYTDRLSYMPLTRFCTGWQIMAGGDPRLVKRDYTVLPTQYLFQSTSIADTWGYGKAWSPTFRGDGLISRTGWTSADDTHVISMARTYADDHDVPQPGTLHIYKRGALLDGGGLPTGFMTQNNNSNQLDGMLNFGVESGWNSRMWTGERRGIQNAVAFIDRWSGSTPSGDPSSRYAYVRANVALAYNVPINRAQIHTLHFKKPSTEEIVMQYYDVDVSSVPTAVYATLHYPQNGQPQFDIFSPAEGNTSFNVGTGVVTETEVGTGPYTFGLLTKVVSPGTVTLNWEGSSYLGNFGNDYRMTICGGASCGGNVSATDFFAVHKIMQNLSDTTITATGLSAGSNWAGVQTQDKVALVARGGVPHASLSVTTTHSGTAQYLIAGLTAGTCTATVGGSPVTGSPFLVQAEDSTIYFESTAGAVLVSCASPTPPTITTTSIASGSVGSAYSQTISATGDSAITWSIVAGALPDGLSLNTSTGAITGTPTTAKMYYSTIRATNASGSNDADLGIVIDAGSGPTITTASPLPGGTQGAAYDRFISATGGSTPYVWTISSGTLCTGLSFSSAGELSGTPTVVQTCNFTVQVTDALGSINTKGFSLTIVSAGSPLTITTTSPLPGGTQGTAYSQTLNATGGLPSYTWTVSAGTLCSGLILHTDGTITGTPLIAQTCNFTAQVQDTAPTSVTKPFSLTIASPPQSGPSFIRAVSVSGTKIGK